MGGAFEVKRADELLDARLLAKRELRRALGAVDKRVLRAILQRFLEGGGPVGVETLAPSLSGDAMSEVAEAVGRLDEKDLVLLQHGRVVLAYPLSGAPTAFRVVLADGGGCHAVCAVDALGVAPMLGQPVTIRSRCHHCGEPLEITVHPDGPRGSEEVMVWVGSRGDIRTRACTSICLTLNFFRSEEHLGRWREVEPETPGAAASLGEAFRVGAEIFGGLLRDLRP